MVDLKLIKCDSDLLEEIREVLEKWNFSKLTDKKAIEEIFRIVEGE